MTVIYGLFDPRHPMLLWEVRYIGQTHDLTEIRLGGHIRDARKMRSEVQKWIQGLLDDGVKPQIQILERCSDSETLNQREKIWIAAGRNQGWHLTNYKAGGDYRGPHYPTLVPMEERFWAKVDIRGEDECWWWTAFKLKGGKGYGTMGIGSRKTGDARKQYAHIISWEIANGRSVPEGLQVCHTCDNPPCVNPNHIWVGTRSDNMRDAAAKGRIRNQFSANPVTHCPQGHEYTPENTLPSKKGIKACRQCNYDNQVKYRAQKREEKGLPPACPLADRTHCPKGHEYDQDNTYTDGNGRRHCRQCSRDGAREAAKQKREGTWVPQKSEEERAKQSERQKGTKRSPETRSRISESNKGRIVSEETRQKISNSKKGVPNPKTAEANRGRKPSGETRKKISDAVRANPPTGDARQRMLDAGKARPSEETKQKMSDARKAWWIRKKESEQD